MKNHATENEKRCYNQRQRQNGRWRRWWRPRSAAVIGRKSWPTFGYTLNKRYLQPITLFRCSATGTRRTRPVPSWGAKNLMYCSHDAATVGSHLDDTVNWMFQTFRYLMKTENILENGESSGFSSLMRRNPSRTVWNGWILPLYTKRSMYL